MIKSPETGVVVLVFCYILVMICIRQGFGFGGLESVGLCGGLTDLSSCHLLL